ncbi:MAG: hypothetical protein A2583_15735 [Bdellovibrionales bacterium RIFOXYD1_FULL_53_11]|nr:MAG: hypothetical protein A2583_15735 [Bdellovibrionales bacterium RIFOXYD1_FULL_53_11]
MQKPDAHKTLLFAFVFVCAFLMGLPASEAAGKKKPKFPYSTPTPARVAVLGEVETLPFKIPSGQGGAAVTITGALKKSLENAAGDTHVIYPAGPATPSACGEYLYLSSAVTIFELENAKVGIKIGYNPSGDSSSGPLTGLTGALSFKIGNITMAFGLWRCTQDNHCIQVAASDSSSAILSGLDLSVTMNFSELQVGPTLNFSEDLDEKIRKIMENGLRKIAKSKDFNKLPWVALVAQDFNPQKPSHIIFDAGWEYGLKPKQMFEVYKVTPSEGACATSIGVALGHTVDVYQTSSVLEIEPTCLGNVTDIKKGDVIRIHEVANGSNTCH